jgi:KRAB domain-containing zinc finger protein
MESQPNIYNLSFDLDQIPKEFSSQKVKIVLKDLRKEFQSSEREKEKFSDLIREMKKCEKFFEIKEEPKDQKMPKNSEEKVKKDPEGNFLFLSFESPKMPKSIKREVTRKEINIGGKSKTKFSKFQCKICQKYLRNKYSLECHTERHFQGSSFECKRCEKVFRAKGFFDAHKCVKKSEMEFCNFCEKNYKQLSKHMKKFHIDKLNINWFHCDFCDQKFAVKGMLQKHLENFQCRIKTQKNFTCDRCGKEFDKRIKIYQHVQSHAKFKVECKICHVEVKLRSLRDHKNLQHQRKIFECKICKKKFKYSQSLRSHAYSHGPKDFKCQFCYQKFALKGNLNQHLKFHENPEHFKCQICGHQSTTKQNLKRHLKIHDKNRVKDFKCNQCDYKTDNERQLKLHLKVHQKVIEKLEKNPKAIKCEKCPSVLLNKKYYQSHLRMKHGNRQKFQCDLCGFDFVKKVTIRKHFIKKHPN